MVDDADYERATVHTWTGVRYKHTFYAIRNLHEGGKTIGHLFLHRELLGLKKGDGTKVDHHDRNGLNCQRKNLRLATGSQNNANRAKIARCGSRFKGVYLDKRRMTWEASIKVDRKKHYLGAFGSEKDAAKAYNAAATAHFGEFALLNTV